VAARETASRAALLLGGSLLAVAGLEAGPDAGVSTPGMDRLIAFYLSESFDRLRRDLGGGA